MTGLTILALAMNPALAGDFAPLTSGEIGRSAHVLDPGVAVNHFFISYALSLGERTQLDFRPIRGAYGVSIERQLVAKDGFAASIYTEAATLVLPDFYAGTVGGGGTLTLGGADRNRISLGAGASYSLVASQALGLESGIGSHLSLTAHWVVQPQTVWELHAQIDPYNALQQGQPNGSIGVRWIHAPWNDNWNDLRIAVGLELRGTAGTQALVDKWSGATVDLPGVLPYPTVDLWWRI
jgi:hypothetical protein